MANIKNLKNRQEIIEEIASILSDNAFCSCGYEVDLYLYINEEGIGRIEQFENVGGQSWIPDDHITVCSLPAYGPDIVDAYDTLDVLCNAAGVDQSDVVSRIAADNEMDEADVDEYMIRDYIGCHYYAELMDCWREWSDQNEYIEMAEAHLKLAERDWE